MQPWASRRSSSRVRVELILRAGDLFLVLPVADRRLSRRITASSSSRRSARSCTRRSRPAPHLASRGSAGATPRAPRRGPAPRLEPGVRCRQLGCGADRLQQPRVLQHGRVVDQDGHRLALALHHGHRAPRAGIGKRQHPALGVDEHPGPTASSRSPALGRRAPGTARRGACPTVPRRARRRGRQWPLAATGRSADPPAALRQHSAASYTSSDGPLASPGGRTRRAAAVPESTRLRPAVAWRAMRRAGFGRPPGHIRAETASSSAPRGSWRRRSARSG